MTQIMTPSKTTTTGQINKATELYGALLTKHSKEFDAEVVQAVLGDPGLAGEMLAVLRRRVEAMSNLVVRTVKVDRTRSPQEALNATGRKLYIDRQVVDNMPRGEGDEVELVFFKLDMSKRGGWISDDDLREEFDLRGLGPDPISLAAVNEADPAFADEHPNTTHWKDADGNWCYATFGRFDGERYVSVRRRGHRWDDSCWFAGVRK